MSRDGLTMTAGLETWTGHVVVCGLHGVGLRTVEQLHLAGVQVVVVDEEPDPRMVRTIRGWGVPHIVGNARLPETLDAAGLAGAVALVCTESDDLQTLETALLARELRPDVRVVVQLRNPAVGRAVAATGAAVLDVAGLSAPSIVQACLRNEPHELRLGGELFLAAAAHPRQAGTLRQLYGALAPLGVEPRGGGDVVLCPGRDHEVAPGDVVTVLGTPEELRAARMKVAAGLEEVQARSGRSRLRTRLRHVLQSPLGAADRRLGMAVLALLLVITTSTLVLRLGYREPDGRRMTLLDALYFTFETIGTIGYGDFSFREQPPGLRMFAIGLMVVGGLLAATFFALLTNLLISRRIEESLGRMRVTGLSEHVVVVGLGAIGVRVLELLVARGVDAVVVEADEGNRYLARARGLAVPVVVADATQPQTLRTVKLSRAAAVAVTTSDDLVNIETGLAVRDQLGAGHDDVPVVLRLFDRQLARTVESSLGFSAVRSTDALAAPWFVGAALGLEVLSTFYVGDAPLLVASLQVAAGGGLDGLAMQDLSARTRVVALSRVGGGLEHPPRRDTRFAAGDIAYVVGPYEELLQVLRRDTLSTAQLDGMTDGGPRADGVPDPAAT